MSDKTLLNHICVNEKRTHGQYLFQYIVYKVEQIGMCIYNKVCYFNENVSQQDIKLHFAEFIYFRNISRK